LSRYIIENKAQYYAGLRGVTEQHAWETWILYMLDAVENTARLTCDKIGRIRKLIDEWTARVKAERKTIYSKDLIELVFRHPYCKIRFLEEEGLATRQTASKYLQALVELKLLRSVKVGRELYFINEPFVKLLER
jgi:Fic family protein